MFRKVFCVLGIIASLFVCYQGYQFKQGAYLGDLASAATSGYLYDSGYAAFGGDFYTYVNNNAGEAADACRAINSNVKTGLLLMQSFFSWFLLGLGGIGTFLFAAMLATPDPVVNVQQPQAEAKTAPMTPPAEPAQVPAEPPVVAEVPEPEAAATEAPATEEVFPQE